MRYTLPLADSQAKLSVVGGKGASLARLVAAELPVPDGFHVTTDAYRQFIAENDLQPCILAALESVDADQPATLEAASTQIRAIFATGRVPTDVAAAIEAAYTDLANSQFPVAVRSSATAEDLPDLSFAGQQETYLNVRGAAAVQDAAKRCWASLWTARAIGYRARHNIDQDAVSLAVVVQIMAPAEAAGIMFTANPLNGSREEVMVNAAWGLGEAIVSGLVSPDTIIADKATGQVKQIEVADKAVMTVPTPEGTTEQPVAESRRNARVLDDAQVAELARLGRRIEALYDTPQDIEWCWAQGQFFIVQSRPITTLGETALPEVPPPSKWKGPNRRAKYMRVNIVELMPNPLTPLFATLGRRIVNVSMNRLMMAFFAKPGLMPEELVITIHDYAYYNGEFTAKQIGQILLGSVGIMKRMFTGAEQRWRDARSRYKATVEEWQARPWRESSATEILHSVPEVLGPAIAYYGALVGGVIPAAWISEGLFTVVYDRLIKRKNDPSAPTYLLGFDSAPILAEKALYDLAQWARTRPGLAACLSRTPAAQIAVQYVHFVQYKPEDAQTPPGVDEGDWREWQARFRAYLQQYGATIYDLDFANPTPADDPTPVLETCKLFLRGEGSDPHARQRAAAERREQATQAMLNRLRGLRLRLFRNLVTRAQKYAPQREDGLADIGLGYPLIRQMLLEVGRRLVQAGGIAEAADVFWLVEDEVEQAAAALDRGEPVSSMTDAVRQRKALWQAEKRVTPPVSLPLPPKFLMKVLPGQFGGQTDAAARVIRGTPCSPGSVTATARVMHRPQDFNQMRPGDVLVAAITTPAWTPLFAMASAIVTDIGGPLSHGSIVAREYGIPAVLGTGVATRRIRSGQMIAVDGGQGIVEILREA
ncbi:MAG: phosphoenolpyruvate synthase [Anaerolineae bacterium]|nr:phosphoenolpyruvate synthase [Anaerolineae bacterium]